MVPDNLELVLKLEQKVDQLLDYCQVLARERQQLREENLALLKERDVVCSELDRILGKLDGLDGETP
jgi:FtsZ-binding cell division protein ZapB